MRAIDLIIVHCTATPAGRPVSVADVDRWHRERGFDGIGYHYLIGLDGTVYPGRDIERAGAHCLGRNARSIGVCYVGGLDSNMKPCDTRTPAQRQALVELLRQLRRQYPGAAIRGHRDFAAKDCPCFDATKEYANL
ncbi:MAG: N-acetylmuramoyl-L-alanine amidase [Muribaculaceae bacterium]|nr:N-acetylmuramoyl-L-alanine amidase [Muribaculaceae bacterium]